MKVAFAPKSPSDARAKAIGATTSGMDGEEGGNGEEGVVPDDVPDDDGCAVFWRSDKFVCKAFDFVGLDDFRRNDGTAIPRGKYVRPRRPERA